MTEAFEIGVSLALQDGVSDAIGKARRDVVALEHAIRESGVSVQSLREAGARVSSVAFSDRRSAVAEEPVKRMVQEVAPAVAQQAMPAAASPLLAAAVTRDVAAEEAFAPTRVAGGRDSEAVALQAPQAPDARPGDTTRIANFYLEIPAAITADAPQPVLGTGSAPLVAGAPRAAVGLADRRDDVPAVREGGVALAGGLADQVATASARPAIGMAPIALRERAQAPLTPPGVVAVPGQPGAPLLGPGTGPEGFSMPSAVFSAGEADVQGDRGYVSLLSALRLSGGSAASVQGEGQVVAQPSDAPVGNDAVQSEPVQQAPAVSARRESGAPPAGLAAAAQAARAQDAPQQADRREAGPQEGDVFLDGMLVGRWISKFLNREAGKASAGPTGFDARRGQLLPGVTVGS